MKVELKKLIKKSRELWIQLIFKGKKKIAFRIDLLYKDIYFLKETSLAVGLSKKDKFLKYHEIWQETDWKNKQP
jgi:hypothetical protein